MRPNTLGLPGPSLWDVAREFREIRADPLAFLEQTHGRYGDLVALPLPGPPTLLLSDPEAVRHVLRGNARHWSKATRQYSALATVTGPGLLAVSDDRWLDRRRIASPAFHHSRFDAVGQSIVQACSTAVHSFGDRPDRLVLAPEGEVVDVYALSMQITLDVVGRTLFARDLADLTDQADLADVLVHAASEAAELVVAQGRSLPWPPWVPTSVKRRLRRCVTSLDGICRALIADRRAHGVSDRDTDLLGQLIAAGLPDEAIRDELVTMVLAGHETVASALAWTLMLLAEHPEVQRRLRDEPRERHTLARAVVDESLRLFPPGWVISRKATHADSVGGHNVPAGTLVIISPWLLHRNARFWPQPEEFRPERFLAQTTTHARPDYIPFGLGPRMCIGRELALLELTTVLSELLANHAFELPPGWRRPKCHALATLRPRGGLRLVVTPIR